MDKVKKSSSSKTKTADKTVDKVARDAEKAKKKSGVRGIETLYRSIYRVHVELSAMADNKAGLLITLNTLLLGLSGPIFGLLGDQGILIIPLAIIILAAATSLILSVLVARPRITKDPLTLEELLENKGNILFFGNFTRLTPDDFVRGMDAMIEEPAKVYPQMTRDIHSLGLILQKKFRMLRAAYTVIMIGIPTGSLLFVAFRIYIALSA